MIGQHSINKEGSWSLVVKGGKNIKVWRFYKAGLTGLFFISMLTGIHEYPGNVGCINERYLAR